MPGTQPDPDEEDRPREKKGHNTLHDEETGRMAENYSDEKFIEALRNLNGMGSSREVHEHVGTGAQETAYKRLRKLEEEGRITSRLAGSSKMWILPEVLDQAPDEQTDGQAE